MKPASRRPRAGLWGILDSESDKCREGARDMANAKAPRVDNEEGNRRIYIFIGFSLFNARRIGSKKHLLSPLCGVGRGGRA